MQGKCVLKEGKGSQKVYMNNCPKLPHFRIVYKPTYAHVGFILVCENTTKFYKETWARLKNVIKVIMF